MEFKAQLAQLTLKVASIILKAVWIWHEKEFTDGCFFAIYSEQLNIM
jgi:hypothetical protein